ncbi:hypothetical protein BDB00DRAFT_924424 [Zychaea mexicana]|uniref:uncharacterized protein n=1 Tax=Zychaea mexicana TaxID=64656 RepID=UPI0022FDBC58|nr:uncharacterized protein BDB00DRAFT_924424 [Zychaea mexicana]KAI9499149.1 hypothetical protein BDB00DRAFT_924424 [Zychaea mexicana]
MSFLSFFKKSKNYGTANSNAVEDRSSDSSDIINDDEPASMRLVPGAKIPNPGKYLYRRLVGLVISLVIQFIRKRRVDVLGCIIALPFILSGIISIVNGDARAALIRDSAVGAVIGGMFSVTLIPLRTKWLDIRPLTFIIADQMFSSVKYRWTDRDGNPQEHSIVYRQWEIIRFFRLSMYGQSAAWGFCLIMELVACVLMVEVSDLSTDDIVKYNNIIDGVVIGCYVIGSIYISHVGRKIVMRVGKKWTEENDFTDKFERQKHEQQEQQEDQVRNNDVQNQHYVTAATDEEYRVAEKV